MTYSAYSLCINMSRSIRSTGTQLRLLLALVFAMLTLAQNLAHAQEAIPVGFESSVVYTGLHSPTGVAVDYQGNIYVADSSSTVVYLEALQSNGTYIQTSIGTGLSSPYGVAVDSNLNVFISNTGASDVIELTPTVAGVVGTYTQSTIYTYTGIAPYNMVSSPEGIAVDANGNVYVTDPTNSFVIELTPGTPWAVTEVTGSVSSPYGVTVDSNFNIFIADTGAPYLLEVPSTCVLPCSTLTNIGPGTNGAKGVGVDSQNDLYVANTNGGQLYKEYLQYNGTYAQVTLMTGVTHINAVAVDSNFNIYFNDPTNNRVIELSPTNGNFGQVAIGTTDPNPITLTFSFLTGGTIGNILAVQKGATGSDFSIVTGSGAGTCAIGYTYATGATCTVNVTFSPLYSGTRYGAVELLNADPTPALFATAYVYGTGEGPQVVFLPGVQNDIYGNFGTAATVAVDGNDNIYVASQSVTTAYEYTAASGYTNAIALPGSYNLLTDTNVDGAGNVYLTAWTSGIAYKLIAADNFDTVIAIDTGISEPTGTAVDGQGNVFVSSQTGYVNEVLEASDYTIITKIYNGTHGIADLAVDGAGDVYDLNYDNGTVSEIMAVDHEVPANPTVNTILTGLTAGCCEDLESIKVDNVGNVFVADWATNSITEYYVSGGFSSTNSAVVYPFTAASDMAIDGQGNLWASSGTLDYIGWLTTANQDPLYFNASDGTTSAAQDVYIKNIGNQTLTFPDTSSNPSISTYYAWTTSGSTVLDGTTYPDCPVTTSSPVTLAVDAVCGFPITFSPPLSAGSGAIDGQLVLTDNAGIYTGTTTQTVLLYGNATGPIMTVTADSYYMGNNGPIPTLYYTEDGVLGDAVCSGKPSLSTSPAPGSAPYTSGVYPIVITAGTFTCTGYSQIVFVNGTLTVGKTPALLTLTTVAATVPYGQPIPTLTYTLTGFQGGDTQATVCTGAPSITTIATSSSAPGAYTISGDVGTLTCNLSSNYQYEITVVQTAVLTITKDTPTISWAPSGSTIDPASTGISAGQLDAIALDGTTNVSLDGSFVYKYGTTVITAGYVLPLGNDSVCVVWTPTPGVYATDFNPSASTCYTFTVSNKPLLTITAQNLSIVYGTTPSYTYVANPATLPAGCTIGSGGVTFTLVPPAVYTPVPVSNPTYSIVPGNVTCTTGSADVVDFIPGTLTVTQDTPVLTYSLSSVPFGTQLGNITHAVTNTNSGAVVNSGGTFAYTWQPLTPTPGPATSELSTYTPAEGTGKLCEVWTPSPTIYVAGILSYASQYNPTVSTCETVTVTSINLVITANNATITYGAGAPTYTYSSVPATFPSNCTGTVSLNLSPAPTYTPYTVGTYTIVPSGITCTGGNTVSYVNGTLTVAQDTPNLYYTGSPTLTYGQPLTNITNSVLNSNNNTPITADGTFTYTWGGTSELGSFTPPAGTAQLCEIWTPDATQPPAVVGSLTYASQYTPSALTCETVTVATYAISVTTNPTTTISYGAATPTFTATTVPATLPSACGAITFTLSPTPQTPAQAVTSYSVTPVLNCGTNYTVTAHSALWTVTKDTAVVSITPTALPYGSSIGTLTYGATNSNNATVVSSTATPNGTWTYTWNGVSKTSTFVPDGPGTLCATWAPSSATIAGTSPALAYNAEYNTSTSSPCVTITSSLTITAGSPNITYGATPSYSYVAAPSTLPPGCTIGAGGVSYTLSPNPVYSPIPVNIVSPFNYTITPGNVTCTPASNVTVVFVNGTLTVAQDTPNLTYPGGPATITYGAALNSITSIVTNSNSPFTPVTADGTISYYWNGTLETSGAFVPPAGSGTLCEVWTPDATTPPAVAGSLTYASQYNPSAGSPAGCVAVTVNTATVTVTAGNVGITYGATPSYTYSTIPATLPGVCSGTVSYSLSPNPAFSPIPVNTTAPFNYTITPAGITCTGGNYTVSNVTGTLTVSQDTPVLTYPGGPATITYGAALNSIANLVTNSNSPFTPVTGDGTISYYWNGTLETSGAFVPSAGSGTLCEVWTPSSTLDVAGSYTYASQYTASAGTPAGCVSVTVNPATVTVTAGNVGITYGATPSYTYSTIPATLPGVCTGTVSYSLSPNPAYSPIPVNTNAPFNYAITPAGITCTGGNYTVSNVNGTLTVAQDTPIVTVPAATITYGTQVGSIAVTAANSNLPSTSVTAGGTFTYTWNGSPVASTFEPNTSGTLCAVWTPPGSVIDIPLTTLTYASQYTASLPGACASITVNAIPLTITAQSNATSIYQTNPGQSPNASFTYTISGFIGTDGSGVLSNDNNQHYGGSNVVCTGLPTLSTPASNTSPVGIYTINVDASGFACTGYTFVIRTGELHVVAGPTPLVITPVSHTLPYGSEVLAQSGLYYTCSIGGTPSGDSTNNCNGNTTGLAKVGSTASSRASSSLGVSYYTANVGVYALNASWYTIASQNYNISFAPGTLTLTTASQVLNVKPNNITITQASCNATSGPVLTYTLTGLINWDTVASTTNSGSGGAPVLSVPVNAQNCVKGTYTNGITATTGTLQLDNYGTVAVPDYDYSGLTATGTGTLVID